MTETAGLEQPPAPPWSDLGDSRDLAAVVRRAYASTPAAEAAPAGAAEAALEAPEVGGDPLALLRRETSRRPDREPFPIGTVAAIAVAVTSVVVLLLTGAPAALMERLRPSVVNHDLPAEPSVRSDGADEPAEADSTETPFTYDSAPPAAATPKAAAVTSAPPRAATATQRTTTKRTDSPTRSSSPATSAPASSAAPSPSSATTAPPAQDPPPEESPDGTPSGGG